MSLGRMNSDDKAELQSSFENIFGILIAFAPLGLIFYYAFFIYDPGTTTETSNCSFENSIAHHSFPQPTGPEKR